MNSGRLTIRFNLFGCILSLYLLGMTVPAGPAEAHENDPVTLKGILALWAKREPSRVDFRKKRYTPALHEPILSAGTLEYTPPDRLLKRVNTPHPASFLIQNHQILILDEESHENVQIGLDDAPEVGQLALSLIALLSGRDSELEPLFDIETRGATSGWTLIMTAKEAKAEGIKTMEVSGQGDQLSKMKIEQADGSIILLEFMHPS